MSSRPTTIIPGTMRWAALAACIAVATPLSSANAQPCCTATSLSDFGVVGRCQKATIATQIGFDYGLGSFGRDGEYHPFSEETRASDWILTLGGGVRLGLRNLQLHASVPIRFQSRTLPGFDSETSTFFGDAALSLRWTA
ncbi:MAG: hypothetical protein KC561_13455, partial [Myxococcales bacterium]|nr:hypothetical protein [Myxococcales bacterium]